MSGVWLVDLMKGPQKLSFHEQFHCYCQVQVVVTAFYLPLWLNSRWVCWFVLFSLPESQQLFSKEWPWNYISKLRIFRECATCMFFASSDMHCCASTGATWRLMSHSTKAQHSALLQTAGWALMHGSMISLPYPLCLLLLFWLADTAHV